MRTRQIVHKPAASFQHEQMRSDEHIDEVVVFLLKDARVVITDCCFEKKKTIETLA